LGSERPGKCDEAYDKSWDEPQGLSHGQLYV
jgi:hypothetical protein